MASKSTIARYLDEAYEQHVISLFRNAMVQDDVIAAAALTDKALSLLKANLKASAVTYNKIETIINDLDEFV